MTRRGTGRSVSPQSLHWMDRPVVAATVRTMIEPDGVVVHLDSAHRNLLWDPRLPEDAMEELRIRWLGSDRRAGQSIRNTSPSGEPEVFAAAGFTAPDVVVVPDGRLLKRTIDDLVAERLATSATAPHLFGAASPSSSASYERSSRLPAHRGGSR